MLDGDLATPLVDGQTSWVYCITDIRLSPISLITDIGLSAHLFVYSCTVPLYKLLGVCSILLRLYTSTELLKRLYTSPESLWEMSCRQLL
jgi:hypothetical protein